MQTIAFYSYKGGVGRTLALANVVQYLATLEQKVFAIDFDLEAPGLHYKFASLRSDVVERGLVDYVDDFSTTGTVPDSLRSYVVEVEPRFHSGRKIQLMLAGKVLSSDYWRRLARINWHDLFYAAGGKGVPLFLELKERIRQEYAPDYLLIDARTGITEMGGVATTLLADFVVSLMANNLESIEGTRAVLRGIKRARGMDPDRRVEILPVVARIPTFPVEQEQAETALLERVRSLLNEPAEQLADTLEVSKVYIFHSEPSLQITEALQVGGEKGPEESPLLQDYLKLFRDIIPEQVIVPRLSPLINTRLQRALEDPDGVQRDLESLASLYPHAESYQALLKFYRLRRLDENALLDVALQYWGASGRSDNSLLWDVVRSAKEGLIFWGRGRARALAFVDAVWTAHGSEDVKCGLVVAQMLVNEHQESRAGEICLALVPKLSESKDVVTCIRLLTEVREYSKALELVEARKGLQKSDEDFQRAWADVAIRTRNREIVKKVLDDSEFQLEVVKKSSIVVAWNLRRMAGAIGWQELDGEVQKWLLRGEVPIPDLVDLAQMYYRARRFDALDVMMREAGLPDTLVADVRARAKHLLSMAGASVSMTTRPERRS